MLGRQPTYPGDVGFIDWLLGRTPDPAATTERPGPGKPAAPPGLADGAAEPQVDRASSHEPEPAETHQDGTGAATSDSGTDEATRAAEAETEVTATEPDTPAAAGASAPRPEADTTSTAPTPAPDATGAPPSGTGAQGPATTPVLPAGLPDQAAAPPAPPIGEHDVDAATLTWLGPLGADQLWGIWVPADAMRETWMRLRHAHQATGLWPVCLGAHLGDWYHELLRSGPGEPPLGAPDADLDALLTRFADEAHVARERWQLPDAPGHWEAPRTTAPPTFSTWAADGWIALVPAREPADCPALLGWDGGVNHGLDPALHTTVLRSWAHRFGAELVALTDAQELELLLTRPPATAPDCLAVASEQVRYCEDIAEPGPDAVEALARGQVPTASWYFWWD